MTRPRLRLRTTAAGAALILMAACVSDDLAAPEAAQTAPARAAAQTVAQEDSAPRPKGAAPDSCHAADRTPAQYETVSEQVLQSAAVKDTAGKVITPASYRTETRHKQVAQSRQLQFETPCSAQMTPEFVQSLQRALAARSLYTGKIDGKIGSGLRQAIRRYQQDAHGLDSAILSMQAAQSLGLIAYSRKDF